MRKWYRNNHGLGFSFISPVADMETISPLITLLADTGFLRPQVLPMQETAFHYIDQCQFGRSTSSFHFNEFRCHKI